jgi:hypothetical protein
MTSPMELILAQRNAFIIASIILITLGSFAEKLAVWTLNSTRLRWNPGSTTYCEVLDKRKNVYLLQCSHLENRDNVDIL